MVLTSPADFACSKTAIKKFKYGTYCPHFVGKATIRNHNIIIMSSSYPTATVANRNALILYQIGRLFEEDSMSFTNSSPPEEDPSLSLSYGICDSLILQKYDSLKIVDRDDDIPEKEPVDIDISQQEVDTAWEAFDSSWEHEVTSSRSPTSTIRSGVRRGRQDGVDTFTEVTLTVKTKTHDGACRERGTSSADEIDIASSISSLNSESAA